MCKDNMQDLQVQETKHRDSACNHTSQADHLIGYDCINPPWVLGALLLYLVFDMLGGAVDVDCT